MNAHRQYVPLLLALIATLWWRVAQRWDPFGGVHPEFVEWAQGGGRRQYIARLDLLP
jgi:hypothetical protein